MSAGDEDTAQWMVRQTNGNTFRFRELTTLQRWIVERKVTRDDRISKDGQSWKRLGDIAELATFFQVVDSSTPAFPSAPAYTPPPYQAPAAPAWPAATPMQPMQQMAPMQPIAPMVQGPPVAAFPVAAQPAQQYVAPAPFAPPPTGAAWEKSPQPLPVAQPSGAWNMGGPEARSPRSSDPDVDFPRKRGGKAKWVVLALVVLVAAGAGAVLAQPGLLDRIKQKLAGVSELAVNQANQGFVALDRDSYASIDQAIDNFNKASSIDPNYAVAHAGLARALVAKAEYRGEQAAVLAAGLELLPADKKEGQAEAVRIIRHEVDDLADRAFNAAKEALKLSPSDVEPNAAMADYYRVKNAEAQMKPLIERARTANANDAVVYYVLGSSVAADPAAVQRASRYFDQALEINPKMQAARFKVARLLFQQGDKDKAMVQTEAILREVPDHERAKALLEQLKPAPVVVPAAPAAPAPPKPLTFDQLIAQAEKLREAEQAQKALTFYEKALELQPEDPDAHTGAGWCLVDLEQYDEAVAEFKTALESAPRLTDAHMGLAEAYRGKGMKRDAIKHYQAYLDVLPDGPDAAIAKRMIQQLGGN